MRCVSEQLSHIRNGDLWEKMESMPERCPTKGYFLPTPICELRTAPAGTSPHTGLTMWLQPRNTLGQSPVGVQ